MLKKLLRYNFWFEHDVVQNGGTKYLARWFFCLLGFTFRVHKFYRGDDDRAPHDHPWPFITFPLTGYWERVFNTGPWSGNPVPYDHYIRPFRFHYRPSSYQHIVLGTQRHRFIEPRTGAVIEDLFMTPRPFWTLVITGRKDRSWGFYPNGNYVYWRNFIGS